MSCSEVFPRSQSARIGIGVNQPQSGLNYPFVAPSTDIRHLVADFYLAYEDMAQAYQHPLRIKWLYGLGCEETTPPNDSPTPTHAVDLVVVDAQDNVVFNSTTANFADWDWGANENSGYDYHVYEWVSELAVCRLVTYTTWLNEEQIGADEDAPRNYANHISPINAVLDERAVYRIPKRVISISSPNGITPAGDPANSITLKTVNLAYGYNTTLTAVPRLRRSLRSVNTITMAAVPGTGAGRYLSCPESGPNIYSINGLSGPNILLAANDCLFFARPVFEGTATLKNKEIKLDTHCPPCCQCDDYVQVATYMNRTADRYRPIGLAAADIVDMHSGNIARWLSQQSCRLSQPLKACLVAQKCAYIDVVAQYCNQCTTCATNVTLNMLLETFNVDATSTKLNTAEVVCGYTNITTPYESRTLERVTLTPVASFPYKKIATAFLGKIDIGNSGKVEFRLNFTDRTPTYLRMTLTAETKENFSDPVGTTIKASCATAPSAPIAVTIIGAQLRCDDHGNTPLPECGPIV